MQKLCTFERNLHSMPEQSVTLCKEQIWDLECSGFSGEYLFRKPQNPDGKID